MSKRIYSQELVQSYFRSKARQLAVLAELAACEHPGLVGGHREEIQRIYLREILPKRFAVGRGMVYGPFHRSREADIVIWDAENYPSLPMADHAFFFADSVRVVIECKSSWSQAEFQDVLDKCCSVRDIVPMTEPNLKDEVIRLQQEVTAMRYGLEHYGIMISRPHIGTAAIFLRGGQHLNAEELMAEWIAKMDDSWPDVLLLLEPGRIVVKSYQAHPESYMGGYGRLEFYDLGEDALLAFTASLLALIADRSVYVEDPLYLAKYAYALQSHQPNAIVNFSLTRPVAETVPLWGSPRGNSTNRSKSST